MEWIKPQQPGGMQTSLSWHRKMIGWSAADKSHDTGVERLLKEHYAV